MAISKSMIGKGSSLGWSLAGSVYVNVAEVFEMTMPSVVVNLPDVTNFDSGDFRERIFGMKDTQPMTFSVNYNESSFSDMFALVAAKRYYKLTLTDGSTMTFQGVLSKMSGKVPVDDKIMYDAEIQPLGDLVFTIA